MVGADLFQQGDFLLDNQPQREQRVVKNPREVAAFTFAYNDTLFARRVHDVMTLISWVRHDDHKAKRVHLVGTNGAAAIAAAARAISGKAIDKLAVDTGGFRFAEVRSYRDPSFLPGAVKYGDVPALLALSAPQKLWVSGEGGKIPELVARTYAAADATEKVKSTAQQNSTRLAVDWLLAR